MPRHDISIYSDLDAFSKLIDEISLSDPESHRRFCLQKTIHAEADNAGPGSLCPKDFSGLDLCDAKKEKSIYTWIRNRTSSLDFGKEITNKKDKKHPIHINKNDDVLKFFDRLQNGRHAWLRKISNKEFRRHRAEDETYYFAGNSQSRFPETLVLIDIDCKETGTLAGALAFANHLKEHHFSNLYIEVSTHGKGAHGFFVLRKEGVGADYINDLLLKRLQPWLRQIMREQKFDVENVEIKGTLPVIEWGRKKLEALTYKSGTLAKLPRIPKAENEVQLRNTTVLTVSDLQRLPLIKEERAPKANKTSKKVVAGSITGKHLSDEEIEAVQGHYWMVAESLMEVHALKTSGKTVATVEDVAIFLMLLKFFTNNMNPDGSMPTKRWQEMWKAVFEAGDINRAFCPQRFKVIRDHLSKLGLLDWKNENYVMGWIDENGDYQKGKACKWQASEELMSLLELPDSSGFEEEKREGTSFIRTHLLTFFKSLTPVSYEETIRPVLSDPDAPLMLNPDEINQYITPFEAFTGLAA